MNMNLNEIVDQEKITDEKPATIIVADFIKTVEDFNKKQNESFYYITCEKGLVYIKKREEYNE